MKQKLHRCGQLTKNQIRWRIIITIATTVGATHGAWYLGFIALYLLYTIFAGHCPLLRMMGVGEQQFYLSLLPKENPSPVLVFNRSGSRLFANTPAQKSLDQVDTFSQLTEEYAVESLLASNESISFSVLRADTVWLACTVQKPDDDLLMVYFQDMTEVSRAQEEILHTQKEIVYAMGEIGETRSKETGNHVKRVAEYSRILAKLADLSDEETEILKTASPMHDIGKVGIPDAILKKPGKLDFEEFEIMKTHAQLGFEMLNGSDRPILKTAAIVAHEHHEKWNGSGYPRGLFREKIHIYGRITAIADVLDALGSGRVYKKAWELDRILELFKEEKGRHFDPTLVEVFIDNLDQFLVVREEFKDV